MLISYVVLTVCWCSIVFVWAVLYTAIATICSVLHFEQVFVPFVMKCHRLVVHLGC